MSSNKINFVYRTTNQINGKIYVGVHRTSNINDGYIGSGTHLQKAIKKYGYENFTREILCFTETYSEAFEIEELIVDLEFVNSSNTYNIKLGGQGGFHYILSHIEICKRAKAGGIKSKKMQIGLHDPKYKTFKAEWTSRGNKTNKAQSTGFYDPKVQAMCLERSLSVEARTKRINTFKSIKHQQDNKNSQYGSMWIYNSSTLECKKIPKDALIPEGYIKGRRMTKK